MSQVAAAAKFRRWHLPWKERVCEEARPFSHGVVFRSPRYPDFWEYNCIRLDRPMRAAEMITAADRELTGCAHRFVEWMIPMPDGVIGELRERGWMANPLVYLLHDGRPLPQARGDLVEVDYDLVRERAISGIGRISASTRRRRRSMPRREKWPSSLRCGS